MSRFVFCPNSYHLTTNQRDFTLRHPAEPATLQKLVGSYDLVHMAATDLCGKYATMYSAPSRWVSIDTTVYFVAQLTGLNKKITQNVIDAIRQVVLESRQSAS